MQLRLVPKHTTSWNQSSHSANTDVWQGRWPGASGTNPPVPQSPCAFGFALSPSTPGPRQHHHCSFLSTGVNTCCISHSGWLPSGQRYVYCPNPSEDGLQVAYLKSETILTSWEEFQCVTSQLPRYTGFFSGCAEISELFLVAPLLLKAYQLASSLRAGLWEGHLIEVHS